MLTRVEQPRVVVSVAQRAQPASNSTTARLPAQTLPHERTGCAFVHDFSLRETSDGHPANARARV